ncbi:MAG TPA: fibrobacter succinogenes major paralogous domain-containing protein [Paludibacter sp.]
MKTFTVLLFSFLFTINSVTAQDSIYVYKAGVVVTKKAITDIDSLSFKYTAPPSGTVKDIDGNVYHWITIGTQKWLVENLKTTKFRTGEDISNITENAAWISATFAAYCNYDNDVTNGLKYGRLYNWYAVNDSRNIAPVGCHVASDAEWTILENYLIANGGNYDGTFIENKIAKALSATTDWRTTDEGDLSTNNFSGFTALPAGYRGNDGGAFYYLGTDTDWWTSTEYDADNAYCRFIAYGFSDERRSVSSKQQFGFSVRCIKD